jgi:hypothetical protein
MTCIIRLNSECFATPVKIIAVLLLVSIDFLPEGSEYEEALPLLNLHELQYWLTNIHRDFWAP